MLEKSTPVVQKVLKAVYDHIIYMIPSMIEIFNNR